MAPPARRPRQPQIREYYIFALQRSGTNYFQKLCTLNYSHSKLANRGHVCWKHSITPPEPRHFKGEQRIFITYKNPYKWIESLTNRNDVDWNVRHKKDKYCSLSKNNLNHEQIDERFVVGKNELFIDPLCHAYRDWVHAWIVNPPEYISSRAMTFKYEDLLEDMEGVMQRGIDRFEFQRAKPNEWLNAQRGGISQSTSYTIEMETYYKQEGKLEVLQPHHIERINEILTPELIERLGYKVLAH